MTLTRKSCGEHSRVFYRDIRFNHGSRNETSDAAFGERPIFKLKTERERIATTCTSYLAACEDLRYVAGDRALELLDEAHSLTIASPDISNAGSIRAKFVNEYQQVER